MLLTRWKLMAGILGVSIGGLAAAASQCPKFDSSKGRSAEAPVKADAKMAPAGPAATPAPPPPAPTPAPDSLGVPPPSVGPAIPAPPQLTPAGSTPPAPAIEPAKPTIPPVPPAPVAEGPKVSPPATGGALPPVPDLTPNGLPPIPTGGISTPKIEPKPSEPAKPQAIDLGPAKTPTPPLPDGVELGVQPPVHGRQIPSPAGDPLPPPATHVKPPVGAPPAIVPEGGKPTLTPIGGTGNAQPGTPSAPVASPPNTGGTVPPPFPPSNAGSAPVPNDPVLPPPTSGIEHPIGKGTTTPPAPPAVDPLGVPKGGEKKFRILLHVGEGEPTFEVKNGENLVLKVACEKVDIKSPEKGGMSEIIARGKVHFAGFGAEGTCDELKFFAGTGEVSMTGDVKVQVKDKLGRIESELTTTTMKYKIDASSTGGQMKP
jgi:hypothetical protein